MSEETKDHNWKQGFVQGHNEKLYTATMGLLKLHRLAIEKKLADMKSHVNIECAKLNHPAAREFAEEINKLKVE